MKPLKPFALALLASLALLSTPQSARADEKDGTMPEPPKLTVVNLPGQLEADHYAQELIAQARQSAYPEILLVHVGVNLPKQLEWVMVHLSEAKIPFRVELIRPDQLEDTLEKGYEESKKVIQVEAKKAGMVENAYEVQAAQGAMQRTMDRSRLFARELFGLPNGMTLSMVFNYRHKPENKRSVLLTSAFQGLIAASSVGVSLYHSGTIDMLASHTLLGIGMFALWVHSNMYWAPPLIAAMNQGRQVVESSYGKFKVVNGYLFAWSAGYIRSLITNTIYLFAAFGADMYSQGRFEHMFPNAFQKLFARQWVDRILAQLEPQVNPDGSVTRLWWQPTQKQMVWIRTIYEFSYGMINNLDLLYGRGMSSNILMGLTAIGLAKLFWDNRWEALGPLVRGADGILRRSFDWDRYYQRRGTSLRAVMLARCSDAFIQAE